MLSHKLIKVFFANLLLSTQIKKHQQRIRTVLEAQKLPFDVIDVAQDDIALEKMRQLAGNEEALAPQIANGDEYCGVCQLKNYI